MLPNLENYGYYKELVQTGYQVINASEITDENIDEHFKNILNILNDGIERREIQLLKIKVVFVDDSIDLFIEQYLYNLMFWVLIVCSGKEIMSYHLFFERVINSNVIYDYVNKWFIKKEMTVMGIMDLNQSIDRSIGKFRFLGNYQMYLCNTLDMKDNIDFMNEFKEFNDAVHFKTDGIPMEDLKNEGMKATETMIKYITRVDRDHNLKYSFISGEGTNKKQFKEVMVNIGTKPNGQGGVFPTAINNSFVNGGLQSIEDILIDAAIGRIAQILQKQNVGQSGAFARRLGLNNQDSRLHPDPSYSCDVHFSNLQKITIKDKAVLSIFNMRWYRFKPNGIDYLLDSDKDKHLIGQTLYFRSPMTCASAFRGEGICFKCYGNLAYANRNINIGQIASDSLSSKYTQTLLSAKHLLESAIIKLEWTAEFYELFNVEFDQITLKDDINYSRMKIIIRSEDIIDNESDDENIDLTEVEESSYIFSFSVVLNDGSEVVIKTNDNDPIYITEDLLNIMNQFGKDEEVYELDMEMFREKSIFMINVQNDELSKTMNQVKNLINNKSTIKNYDKDTILDAFINTNLSGGIVINSVHFEILLMNQIKASDDVLSLPDWTRRNERYQIISLDKSLTNNPRISVRLLSPKLKRTFISPDNRRLMMPSNMDLFTMEHPQEFMSRKFDDPIDTFEEDRKVINPFIFTK